MLTVRAVTVAAGVRHQFVMIALRALHVHLGTGLRAAVLYRRKCMRVLSAEAVRVVREKVCLEGVDDRSEPNHLSFPQVMTKPSIKPLMRSMA